MPKTDPVAVLAGKMVEALRSLRQKGEDYPSTLSRLAAQVDPTATPALAVKALKKKPFAQEFVAAKNHPDSPVALAENAELLAESPELLEFALGQLCKPKKELHPPARVVGKVDRALQPAFRSALERRLAEGKLPLTVGSVTVRGKVQLYLTRLPPPVPAEVALAEKLLQQLEALRPRGEADYPVPLTQLLKQVDPEAKPAVVKKALSAKPFGAALVALPKRADSPVALRADAGRLAESSLLLRTSLESVRSADSQAVALTDLKKKLVKELQKPFIDAVTARLTSRALPADVGCLRIKKMPHLFFLAELGALTPVAPPVAPAAPVSVGVPIPTDDFAARFDEAFARLDRERGSHNLVSLVPLRQALGVERTAFDAGLRQLRRAGRYSLSSAEGRHGLSQEEREAGIVEESSLLLYVSRKG